MSRIIQNQTGQAILQIGVPHQGTLPLQGVIWLCGVARNTNVVACSAVETEYLEMGQGVCELI